MAKNGRWSRYRPPAEVRTETGAGKTKVIPPPAEKKSAPRPKPGSKADGRKTAWIVGGIVAAVVVVPTGIALVANGSDDDGSGTSDVDRELLDPEFIAESFEESIRAQGDQPVGIRIDEYTLEVEYFDPTRDEIITVENGGYREARYQVVVEDNHYDDYRPRRFDLTTIDPAVLVSVAEDAIDRAGDAYSFSVRVSADPETGEVVVEGHASGDELVAVIADVDGEVVAVE